MSLQWILFHCIQVIVDLIIELSLKVSSHWSFDLPWLPQIRLIRALSMMRTGKSRTHSHSQLPLLLSLTLSAGTLHHSSLTTILVIGQSKNSGTGEEKWENKLNMPVINYFTSSQRSWLFWDGVMKYELIKSWIHKSWNQSNIHCITFPLYCWCYCFNPTMFML